MFRWQTGHGALVVATCLRKKKLKVYSNERHQLSYNHAGVASKLTKPRKAIKDKGVISNDIYLDDEHPTGTLNVITMCIRQYLNEESHGKSLSVHVCFQHCS